GMQQKVSIVCALLHDPQVVIFDEPMVGLDPHAINELKHVIRELKEKNKAILISTHLIDTVADIWDVVNILKSGHVIVTKYREQLNGQEENLSDLFFEITENKEQ
ncbi:MAG TPA: ABC transporter ATP-binding protein, partial [Saccharofermentans sp.]|nr:ABC transporter ATP-binding protein [Saccharofermentans sp.]